MKRRLRSVLVWLGWVLALQFVLVNISAALYADKLTHLQIPVRETSSESSDENIFTRTWRLFAGPVMYKTALKRNPLFPFAVVNLKTQKDIPIEAWFGKADSLPKGTVILFHGLTGNKGMVLDEANAFRSFGYNVMLVDLRSHGNSGSKTTTIGYKESEEVGLAYDYVKRGGEKKIFLWGASMGAVAVIKAINEFHLDVSGIIIEMPFLSLQSHLEGRARYLGFPRQPFGFLTSFWIGAEHGFNGLGFRTSKYAKNIKCPVLMQYGEKDELVLRYETDEIFSSIPVANKKLILYDQAGHESFLGRDPALWKSEIDSFLRREGKVIF